MLASTLPANLGLRILAFIIDFIIKFIYVVVVNALLEIILLSKGYYIFDDYWVVKAIYSLIILPAILYTVTPRETIFKGQTLGKMITKIRVIKLDGHGASFADYMIRWICRAFDFWMTACFLGLITSAISKRQQRLGDMASGTAVISLRNKVNLSHTILEELSADYTPTFLTVIKLSDNDVRIIKENFLAANKSNNHKTLITLREKICKVIQQRPPEDMTATKFIDTVIKDYNYLTQNR